MAIKMVKARIGDNIMVTRYYEFNEFFIDDDKNYIIDVKEGNPYDNISVTVVSACYNSKKNRWGYRCNMKYVHHDTYTGQEISVKDTSVYVYEEDITMNLTTLEVFNNKEK